jgi:multidrug efflux pump subunit AcrA (membrane-fusion protein)
MASDADRRFADLAMKAANERTHLMIERADYVKAANYWLDRAMNGEERIKAQAARIAELEAERDYARRDQRASEQAATDANRENYLQAARIAALEAALRRWVGADGGGGEHMHDCDSIDGVTDCTCGLADARALLADE